MIMTGNMLLGEISVENKLSNKIISVITVKNEELINFHRIFLRCYCCWSNIMKSYFKFILERALLTCKLRKF
jgi:hypothetical protein